MLLAAAAGLLLAAATGLLPQAFAQPAPSQSDPGGTTSGAPVRGAAASAAPLPDLPAQGVPAAEGGPHFGPGDAHPASSNSRIDLGRPSVLSQRGQRLKIAVPYGSAPGERVSAMRFWVAAASAPDGDVAPDAQGFVVLKPEHRNLVLLQSREPVTASRVTLTLRVAGQEEASTYELAIPPVQFAPTQPTAAAAGLAGMPKRAARRH